MRRFFGLATGVLLALAAGCVTDRTSGDTAVPPTSPDPALSAEDERIQSAYDHMRDAVLARDPQRVYALLSTAVQKTTGWENFQQTYSKIEPGWMEFYRDAKFLKATHDSDQGNAFLKFRDRNHILGLVLENGEWRIERLVSLPPG